MRQSKKKSLLQFAAILCITCATGLNGAEPDPFGACRSADDGELSAVRGGYVSGSGLEIAFGIDKIVAVNNVLLTNDNLSFVLGGGADSGAMGSMATKVVQSGAGNVLGADLMRGLGSGSFTFIQNSLDGALIRNSTAIDISVTVRDLYRDLDLSSTLNRQLINSLH